MEFSEPRADWTDIAKLVRTLGKHGAEEGFARLECFPSVESSLEIIELVAFALENLAVRETHRSEHALCNRIDTVTSIGFHTKQWSTVHINIGVAPMAINNSVLSPILIRETIHFPRKNVRTWREEQLRGESLRERMQHRASTPEGVQWRQEADEIHNKRLLEHLCSHPKEAANGRAEPLEIQQDHQTYWAQARPE